MEKQLFFFLTWKWKNNFKLQHQIVFSALIMMSVMQPAVNIVWFRVGEQNLGLSKFTTRHRFLELLVFYCLRLKIDAHRTP